MPTPHAPGKPPRRPTRTASPVGSPPFPFQPARQQTVRRLWRAMRTLDDSDAGREKLTVAYWRVKDAVLGFPEGSRFVPYHHLLVLSGAFQATERGV